MLIIVGFIPFFFKPQYILQPNLLNFRCPLSWEVPTVFGQKEACGVDSLGVMIQILRIVNSLERGLPDSSHRGMLNEDF